MSLFCLQKSDLSHGVLPWCCQEHKKPFGASAQSGQCGRVSQNAEIRKNLNSKNWKENLFGLQRSLQQDERSPVQGPQTVKGDQEIQGSSFCCKYYASNSFCKYYLHISAISLSKKGSSPIRANTNSTTLFSFQCESAEPQKEAEALEKILPNERLGLKASPVRELLKNFEDYLMNSSTVSDQSLILSSRMLKDMLKYDMQGKEEEAMNGMTDGNFQQPWQWFFFYQ